MDFWLFSFDLLIFSSLAGYFCSSGKLRCQEIHMVIRALTIFLFAYTVVWLTYLSLEKVTFYFPSSTPAFRVAAISIYLIAVWNFGRFLGKRLARSASEKEVK